jgi:DNA polymerase (family 10)
VTNSEIASVFDHVADLLDYQGGNVFRVRAYRNAAHTIGGLVEPLAAVRADTTRSLTDLDGIGDDLAGKIEELLDTGRLPLLEELKVQVPAAAFELMRVPGLGPKKVKQLVDALGIDSLEALEQACREKRVESVKGFGAKKLEKLKPFLTTSGQTTVAVKKVKLDAPPPEGGKAVAPAAQGRRGAQR